VNERGGATTASGAGVEACDKVEAGGYTFIAEGRFPNSLLDSVWERVGAADESVRNLVALADAGRGDDAVSGVRCRSSNSL